MAKKSTIAKVILGEDNVRVVFSNGFDETTSLSDLAEPVQQHCAVLGLSNKLRDSYANAKDADSAQGLYQKVRDTLFAGEWSAKRGEGGVAEEPIKILAQAVAEIGGKPYDAVFATLSAMDAATRRKIRSNGEVAVKIAQIKAAKSKGPSLAELGLV